MKLMSYFILLAAPLAVMIGRIPTAGLLVLTLPVTGLALAIATYPKVKNSNNLKNRYLIGSAFSLILILGIAFSVFWLVPKANSILEQSFSEPAKAPLTDEDKEILSEMREKQTPHPPNKKR